MAKQSDADDKGFYVGPRVNLLHAQSDAEPYYRWKLSLNDYQVGNLIDAIGQAVDNGDWYGEFCNMVTEAMKQLGVEKLGSNRGNEYTLEDIQARNIRRSTQSDAEPVGILHNKEAGFREIVTRDTFSIYDNNPQPRLVEEICDADKTLIGFRIYDPTQFADPWRLSEEIKQQLEEIERATVRPDPLPREHQDPSKWASKEDMERAHATTAEPVAWRLDSEIAKAQDEIVFWKANVKLRTRNAAPPRPDVSAGHEIGKAIRQEQEMSTRDELNQANNRNGDLLTTISKLQKRIAELEAKPDTSAGLAREIWLNQVNLQRMLSQEELKRLIKTYSQNASDVSAGLIEAAEQARDLLNGRHNVGSDAYKAFCILNAAISRSRAADRSKE